MTGSDSATGTLLSQRNPAMLFLRLYRLLEQRQETDPDVQRQAMIERLGPLRNRIALNTDLDTSEWALLDSSVTELVDYLRLVESSSLGTPQAQTNRLLSTAREIDDVLGRSPIKPPSTDVPSHEAPSEDGLDDLAVLASQGDKRAAEELLARIRPPIVKYCQARVGWGNRSKARALDVAHEICLAVLSALPNYRGQGRPFLAFVYGIAAHKVADAHRAAARNLAESLPELPDSAGTEPGPEQQALRGELSERMGQLLSVLPERQREILVLRVVLGMSAEETAEIVHSTPGAVRVAQHRALARLRKAFNDAETSSDAASG